MPVQLLPPEDQRDEILCYEDASFHTVSAEMRAGNPRIYAESCGLAVRRRFPNVVDAKARPEFPKVKKETISRD
jgi:hypothetical protein